MKNAYNSLKENSPMLFFRESYRKDGTYNGIVNSVEEWAQITGEDYNTPQLRQVRNADNGSMVEIFVPLLPARAKDKNQYVDEFNKIGFHIEKFIEMNVSNAIPYSASIYVRKGK